MGQLQANHYSYYTDDEDHGRTIGTFNIVKEHIRTANSKIVNAEGAKERDTYVPHVFHSKKELNLIRKSL